MLRGLLVLVLALAATGIGGARLERISERREGEKELLYLPNGSYLRVASLGQQAVLADLIYLWAIQYYSNYDRADRFRYVEHVFSEVITELDPQFVDAYWLGALILTTEAKEVEAGIALLDKGIENNPENWALRVVAGWECHSTGQFERAASYFCDAADLPGAPRLTARMCAGMFRLAGDAGRALEMWHAVQQDPNSDSTSLAIAERQVRDLTVRIHVELLDDAISRFQIANDRFPASLEQLVSRGYIDSVPLDPDGQAYVYDPQTGHVGSSSGRLLGER